MEKLSLVKSVPGVKKSGDYHGKIVFSEISSWCQKIWGLLLQMVMTMGVRLVSTMYSRPRMQLKILLFMTLAPIQKII